MWIFGNTGQVLFYLWIRMTHVVQTSTVRISFDGKTLISEVLDNVEIDAEAVESNFTATQKITGEHKYLSLVITGAYTTITKEGREATNDARFYKNVLAQAIVVQSLASRIMGNFLIGLYKKYCPQRLFNSREEAEKWLEKYWEKHRQLANEPMK